MNCPYCGKELIEGYIYGSDVPLVWMPKDKKPFLGSFPTQGEVLKESDTPFKLPKVTAYKCGDCKKLIVNL